MWRIRERSKASHKDLEKSQYGKNQRAVIIPAEEKKAEAWCDDDTEAPRELVSGEC